MDILKLAKDNLIEKGYSDVAILEIATTGSQMFRDNPKDIDYLAICDGLTVERLRVLKTIDNVTYDILYLDKDLVSKRLNFNEDSLESREILYNYMYMLRTTIYGERQNSNWDMFDYKYTYLMYIKKQYEKRVKTIINKQIFSKLYVHYYVLAKFFSNNNTTITEAMRSDLAFLYTKPEEKPEEILEIVDWINSYFNSL